MGPLAIGPSADAVTVDPARQSLQGEVRVPGDKSISHRAAIMAAMGKGDSVIRGFSPSADCASTLRALRELGVDLLREGDTVTVHSRGVEGWKEPEDVLDLGNSGTSMRLLAGVLAGCEGLFVLTGDDSLRRRPMGRIVEPLRRMGAAIDGRKGGQLAPLVIKGQRLRGAEFSLEVASAQVKSCLLLAGLMGAGETWVEEPLPTRDHTERLLAAMGVEIGRRPAAGTGHSPAVGVRGPAPLSGLDFRVPGDPSAAAFLVVAGCLVPGSRIVLPSVGLNPYRIGFLTVLARMGAKVEVAPAGEWPEPVGDLVVTAGDLQATDIGPEEVPSLIDELPILAVAATRAHGTTRVWGAGELRVKESDRLTTVAAELSRLGADIQETPDGWIIRGPCALRGGRVSAWQDHRLAMSWGVAALVAQDTVTVAGAGSAAVSYPGFFRDLADLGASVGGLADLGASVGGGEE
ncbi:MAG TPA: 3-phosphoshikimate 1-carboxyvinyltransferase [Firmicutes bacterium]|nr:3-phosphoshikimate 1-carboxyvinyltransferase [Bacillota bacterium]